MPSGRVHSATTAMLSAGLYYASYRAGYPLASSMALAGGCLAGILLSPDLDVDGQTISNHHARRLGGCAFGLAWSLIWRPYAALIPHRSPLSHAPLLGTALRIAYLLLIAQLIVIVFRLTGFVFPPPPVWWPWSFAGLALADLLHFVLDKTIRVKR